ncbi:hypothetical protein [Dactylosporangium sp. CA-139066]|uniref:hypothetical protein n=1 Tax=Dactylosporangium sp. CA-139066 TaxID=3239930 RepID=UPI003D9245B3
MTDLDPDLISRRQCNAEALLAGNLEPDADHEAAEADLRHLVGHDVQALLCELERLADQDVLDMLGSIDNALRNGSHMTNANLAFLLLCERLGVDRDRLVFNPQRIGEIAAEVTR